jgi:hypothetical protein
MKVKILPILYTAIAVVASLGGYLLVSPKATVGSVQARSLEMPARPSIFYLTTSDSAKSQLSFETIQNNGVESGQNWLNAQNSEKRQALDALIIEAPFLQNIQQFDKEWLVSKFRDGVVIVSLGADHDTLAQALGLKTLRNSNERPKSFAPNEYLMVQVLWLGQPDDLEKYEASGWLAQQIEGNNLPIDDVHGLVITSFAKSIGEIGVKNDLNILFNRISSGVEAAYSLRADYLELMVNSDK